MSDTVNTGFMLNADTLISAMNSLKANWDKVRKGMTKPKVDTTKAVESLSDDQKKVYQSMRNMLDKLDKAIHSNYDSAVAQIIHQELRVVTSDSMKHTQYVTDIDVRESKVELDSELATLVSECKKMREQCEHLHGYLVASGVEIPDSVYKHEDGKLYKTRAGNTVLDLPRIFDVGEDGTVNKAGRVATSKVLVLGTVDDIDLWRESPEVEKGVTWHENDHVGTTFMNLYGSIRGDHNFNDLVKEVEKSEQSVTKGWDKPVEYAGKFWVAKVKG